MKQLLLANSVIVKEKLPKFKTWLEFSVKCQYLERSEAKALYATYDQILGKLVTMINHPQAWLLHGPQK